MGIAEKRLWHDRTLRQVPLGCAGCRELPLCGGLCVEAALWNCLSFCCEAPNGCDRVCRNNPRFATRVNEVGGFALSLPTARSLPRRNLPTVVPEVFHGAAREHGFASPVIGVSLYRMFDRRTGTPRFQTHAELCKSLKIAEGANFILIGIQRDRPLERWWELGKARRRDIISAARDCGATLTTAPNFSLFIDRPRWDDMHAMKRIALIHHEFLDAGMPAALHINGRTDTDFERWAEYAIKHPEIQYVSYEFTTGTGRPARRRRHAAWLIAFARAVNRPLHLLVRGGTDVLPQLCREFSGVTFLDSSAFLKTMMRQRAIKGQRLYWWPTPTADGEPLDDLLAINWEILRDWYSNMISYHSPITSPAVAIA